MDAFTIDRADGRDDGEDWTENYQELPGGAGIPIILESTTQAGVGPRLHQHLGGPREHPAQVRDRP